MEQLEHASRGAMLSTEVDSFEGMFELAVQERRALAGDARFLCEALLRVDAGIRTGVWQEQVAAFAVLSVQSDTACFHLTPEATEAILTIQRFYRSLGTSVGRTATLTHIREALKEVRQKRFEQSCLGLNQTLGSLYKELEGLENG